MVGRQVASMPQVTVASPTYLARYDESHTLAELSDHVAVNDVSSVASRALPSFSVAGEIVDVSMRAIVLVTGAELSYWSDKRTCESVYITVGLIRIVDVCVDGYRTMLAWADRRQA